ncbi:MAG: 2-succinyl-5-enolpyruvyl-6-hydroxy-3-cyclohexene-1-carboxylic-acid synthase [Candidatus Limnocylindria bacterium]
MSDRAGAVDASSARAAAPILRAFVEELVRAGVREAVVCPGSRSTPLALALAAHDGLRTSVLLDERSAGFVALGMARTSHRPVVLLGTSGTAVVNFAPAVVEASLARVPLVVLTADRPIELRDRGAAQTIDQIGLYGRHVRWATELPLPDVAPETLAHTRSVAGRAVATAVAGPAGPVHVNAPFREPLIPDGVLGPWPDLPGAPFSPALAGPRRLADADVAALAERIGATPRGLILAGPLDGDRPVDAIARLAAAAGYPILADPLSGVRAGDHDRSNVVARADQLARPSRWLDAHQPDLVIRFGAMPTSKPILQLLQRAAPELVVIDGDGGWREAALIPATFAHADAAVTADDLAARLARIGPERDPAWRAAWLAADAAADAVMTRWQARLDEPFEGAPFARLPEAVPAGGAIVWAGNSMPVRDLDGWLPSTDRSIIPYSNRGANGIDGVVSTALGSAAVADRPVLLVVGDVSFLHDLGALVTARLLGVHLTVVVVHNDGGGIFSFLPQAATDAPGVGLPANYERLFGTPHGIAIGPLVEAAGHRHVPVDGASLRDALHDALTGEGLTVLELRTDRARNVGLHRTVAAAVRDTLEGLPG